MPSPAKQPAPTMVVEKLWLENLQKRKILNSDSKEDPGLEGGKVSGDMKRATLHRKGNCLNAGCNKNNGGGITGGKIP